MNTFKKKTLFAALTGLSVMGMVGAAQAVSLNPDGLGQVLIYPYYTVRANADGNAYNSMISVVNSTGNGKVVKVRFLEGKASQEVLDFNLFLSPQDVWVGVVGPGADASGAAVLATPDTSCTAPIIPPAGVAFKNVLFSGSNADGEDATLNRTREGYAEIIEMADIVAPSPTFTATKHATVSGVWKPGNCAAVQDGGAYASIPTWVGTDLTTGSGGLFGSMTLINVNDAKDVAYEATALDSFYKPLTAGQNLFFNSGDIKPNLANVFPATSTVVNGANVYITSGWTTAIDAVSAVLMNQSVYNEFVLDDSVGANTDWVITMPTKGLYYSQASNGRNVTKLFQRNFGPGGACDDLGIDYYDREERFTSSAPDFSPPSPQQTNAMCWEANVVTFGKTASTTSVLRAENRVTLPVEFDNGWAKFTFNSVAGTGAYVNGDNAHILRGVTMAAATNPATTATSGQTQKIDLSQPTPAVTAQEEIIFTGLPMLGFGIQVFNNGQADSEYGKIWASYAGRIAHRFSKSISTAN